MAYSFGCKKYPNKIGILLAQLGTPDAPTKKALRKYLKEFLGDPRIIEKNRVLWWLILNGIILNTRPKKSAALYARIWEKEGSPLLLITQRQTQALRESMQKIDSSIEVEFGMRYGSHPLSEGIDKLIKSGCSRILLFPMYPHYSATTTGSIYDAVFPYLLKRRFIPTLRVAEPYFRHPAYIEALQATINDSLQKITEKDGAPEKLVLSYHGIPKEYIKKGDPYCCSCTETTMSMLPGIEMKREDIIHTYQSRFGKDPWLTPYTDETIEALAKENIKHIALACPGFTADCLETLDELGNEGEELFHENGGEKLSLVPCLNDQKVWIEAMKDIAMEEISSWLNKPAISDPYKSPKCSLVGNIGRIK